MSVVALVGAALIVSPGPRVVGQDRIELYNRDQPNLIRRSDNLYQLSGADKEMQALLSEEGKSEREAATLVRDYARTENDAERAKIKTKLTELLSKEFDTQQKRRDLELTRLEAQVKKLRDIMRKRSDARQSIVQSRLDQLIREAEGLGWTASPALPNANFQPFTQQYNNGLQAK
jgi:hypothetical protein